MFENAEDIVRVRHIGAAAAAFALLIAASSVQAASAREIDEDVPHATSRLVITNSETGEVLYESTEQIELDPDGHTATVDAGIAAPASGGITPLATVGGTLNPGSITSSITLQYSLTGDQIRFERSYGGWSPASGFEVRNRAVDIYNGGLAPSQINKNPTSNSYNYSTGWGWITKPPSGSYTSPRTHAVAQYRLAGVNGTWLTIDHWVDLSSV